MKKIPRNVVILGLVSFFNDLAAEMVYPIVPIFLTTVLKTSVPVVGIIEGIAEATASIGKYVFGSLSDYFQRRKVFVVLGYSFGAASKLLIGLATSWPLVLFARFIDRSGKGLRTAPRDSLLLENTTQHNRGFIFGFHRALDSLGAVFGPILGLVFLYLMKEDMRLVFYLAFIPSVIAVVILMISVKEKKHVVEKEKKHFVKIDFKSLNPNLKTFLIVNFIFSLGNSSDAFLILRAKDLGLTTIMVTLTYVLYNIFQATFAVPAGQLADRIGARKVFAFGLLIFSLVYFLFGFVKDPAYLWIIFPVYGLYIAFTDGVSKAYVSQFVKKEESGSYFGMHQTLMAAGIFMASTIGGFLWNKINPSATFYYGSTMSFIALAVFYFSRKSPTGNPAGTNR
jgi:MFS family permease